MLFILTIIIARFITEHIIIRTKFNFNLNIFYTELLKKGLTCAGCQKKTHHTLTPSEAVNEQP